MIRKGYYRNKFFIFINKNEHQLSAYRKDIIMNYFLNDVDSSFILHFIMKKLIKESTWKQKIDDLNSENLKNFFLKYSLDDRY